MIPAEKNLPSLIAGPTLVLDACGTTIFAGLLCDGKWLSLHQSSGEALMDIFALTQSALNAAGIQLNEVGQFIYAAGPGSTLGIRVSCMAISTWMTTSNYNVAAFRYNSLHLATLGVHDSKPNALFAIAIRKGIYLTTTAQNTLPEFTLMSTADLKTHESQQKILVTMGSRFDNDVPPPGFIAVPYNIDGLPEILSRSSSLVDPVPNPQPYTFGNLEYKKWEGDRHRSS